MNNEKGKGKSIIAIICVVVIAVVAIWGGSKLLDKKEKTDINKEKNSAKQAETTEPTTESTTESSTEEYRTEISKEEFENNKKKDEELIDLVQELRMQDDRLEYEVFEEESIDKDMSEEEIQHRKEITTEDYFRQRQETIDKIMANLK